MSIDENLRLATEFVSAYNERELDRGAALFADPEMGGRWRDAMANYWFQAFPDAVWEADRMTAQDDRVVIEAVDTGTHLGELKWWVKDPVPATNKRIEFQSCAVLTCKNGKLAEFKAYFSPMTILGQLGIRDNVAWPPPVD